MSDNAPSGNHASAGGEPAVEDIRSQWQKLDGAAAPPTNLQEWQMRQRALKEQERKKKTDAADGLHKYRGDLKESDTKLAALREEDRKGKMNAERLLHNYRAPVGPDQTGAAETDSSTGHADAVASRPGGHAAVMGGDVSGIVGAFDTKPEEPAPVMEDPITMTMPAPAENGVMAGAESTERTSAMAEPAAAVPTQPSAVQEDLTKPPIAEGLENNGVLVKEPEATTETAPQQMEEWVKVNPNEGAVDAQQQQPTRFDIDFSFGLLSNTTETEPPVTKYIKAVEEIVKKVVESGGGQISYSPACPPFVKYIERDAVFVPAPGKSNVVRYVVHGAVPVFVSFGTDFQAVRMPIRGALKAAVRDGSFLDTALQLEKSGIAA